MAENVDNNDKTSVDLASHETEKPSDKRSYDVDANDKNANQTDEQKLPETTRIYNASKKKIQHYFFEFLMLFLAVFCGFLAENWREQMQEQNRENEFILSIIEDLKSDTLHSGIILARLKQTSAGIDSVLIKLSSLEVLDNSNDVYRLWTKNLDIKSFVSNDRTIQQLKNSGELRLIRNKAVSDGIMKYDQTVKNYYQQSNFMYNALSDQHIYSQFFDFISLNKNDNTPVPLTEQGKKSLNEAYAHLQLWNAGLQGLISWLEEVNNDAKTLMIFIQKEYDIL